MIFKYVFGQMILHFQKEVNLILYIIEKYTKLNLMISFEQNVNKIWNFKVDICVMFKIKYWINTLSYMFTTSEVVWW
jgi:hypothetical protein